ncbi:methyltransferase [Marinospirillum perlucidum]|uniref:methyltransferase n=1 Tax=Marinospirillum perlucidum TaxID=1982602 RepID=UPI000DF20B0B|nr:methyltransferase [Marinospirillum perlucidum]
MSSATSSSPLDEVILRHLPDWQDQPLNLVAPPGDFRLAALTPATAGLKKRLWSADYRQLNPASQAGWTPFFVSDRQPEHLDGRSLLFWPKAKEEGYWWLQELMPRVGEGLYLLGDNKGGIKAAAKALEKAGFQLHKVDSARRCSLYYLHKDASLSLPLEPSHEVISGPDQLQLCSLPGVFSHGRVDEGSLLLIAALRESWQELPQQGRLLDIGAGGGLLGAWMLHQGSELELTACDVSGLALQATRQTLELNQLKAEVQAADIFTGLDLSKPVDLIITNPPFHTGRGTDYELASRLIREAPQHLKPGGQLWLVANRFLPYPDLLDAAFGGFKRRAETGKFTVYQAVK